MAKLNARDYEDLKRGLEMLPRELQFEGTLTDDQGVELMRYEDDRAFLRATIEDLAQAFGLEDEATKCYYCGLWTVIYGNCKHCGAEVRD